MLYTDNTKTNLPNYAIKKAISKSELQTPMIVMLIVYIVMLLTSLMVMSKSSLVLINEFIEF